MGRSENLKKGTDHSSLPHVSGGNETDRIQKRGDYELSVCVRVCVRTKTEVAEK